MKNKQNRRNRKLGAVIGLLALSGIAATSTTYAWWNTVKDNAEVQITVGERITLEVTTDTHAGGNLIPSDIDPIGDQVVSITTLIGLNITAKQDIDELKLKVTDEGRTFDGVTSPLTDYFTVKVDDQLVDSLNSPELDLTTKTFNIEVKVTLDVPEADRDEDLADDLTEGIFAITLGFELINA